MDLYDTLFARQSMKWYKYNVQRVALDEHNTKFCEIFIVHLQFGASFIQDTSSSNSLIVEVGSFLKICYTWNEKTCWVEEDSLSWCIPTIIGCYASGLHVDLNIDY